MPELAVKPVALTTYKTVSVMFSARDSAVVVTAVCACIVCCGGGVSRTTETTDRTATAIINFSKSFVIVVFSFRLNLGCGLFTGQDAARPLRINGGPAPESFHAGWPGIATNVIRPHQSEGDTRGLVADATPHIDTARHWQVNHDARERYFVEC